MPIIVNIAGINNIFIVSYFKLF